MAKSRINPFPNNKILDSSKLKEFAEDNFKFDEKGTKFSEWFENTVGKGEIARYEQFLLFPQCFQKTCTAETWKPGLVWERVKSDPLCPLGLDNHNMVDLFLFSEVNMPSIQI